MILYKFDGIWIHDNDDSPVWLPVYFNLLKLLVFHQGWNVQMWK